MTTKYFVCDDVDLYRFNSYYGFESWGRFDYKRRKWVPILDEEPDVDAMHEIERKQMWLTMDVDSEYEDFVKSDDFKYNFNNIIKGLRFSNEVEYPLMRVSSWDRFDDLQLEFFARYFTEIGYEAILCGFGITVRAV